MKGLPFTTRPVFGLALLMLVCALAPRPAFAIKCEPSRQELEPAWIKSFGSNSEAVNIYGYSQVVPKRRQSLAELRAELKSLALADLALNVQADVTSSITSQQQFINNDEQQQTDIITAAKTSIRVFDLSVDTFIDQKTCTAFGRVSFAKKDVPYAVAVAEIRRYGQSLDTQNLNLREIEKIEELVLNLEKAAATGSASAQSQLSAFKAELVQIRMRAIEKEADLRLANLSALNAHPDEQLNFIEKLLLNLETLEASGPLSPYQLDGRQTAEERKAEIKAILGSNIVSVYWDEKNTSLNSALGLFVAENKERFWRPKSVYDEEKFLSLSSDFKIERSIVFEAATKATRKFGIDEVDIQLQIRRLGNGWENSAKTQTIKTKAIGRPISNDAIANKIKEVIEEAL